MTTAEKAPGAGAVEVEPEEEELCGAICPEHGDACSVCDGPDMAPMFNTFTLADHREGKSRHVCVPDEGKPHFWSD